MVLPLQEEISYKHVETKMGGVHKEKQKEEDKKLDQNSFSISSKWFYISQYIDTECLTNS